MMQDLKALEVLDHLSPLRADYFFFYLFSIYLNCLVKFERQKLSFRFYREEEILRKKTMIKLFKI